MKIPSQKHLHNKSTIKWSLTQICNNILNTTFHKAKSIKYFCKSQNEVTKNFHFKSDSRSNQSQKWPRSSHLPFCNSLGTEAPSSERRGLVTLVAALNCPHTVGHRAQPSAEHRGHHSTSSSPSTGGSISAKVSFHPWIGMELRRGPFCILSCQKQDIQYGCTWGPLPQICRIRSVL